MRIDKILALAGATLGVALSLYLAVGGKSGIFITTSVLATLAFGSYLLFARFGRNTKACYAVGRRTPLFLDLGFIVFFATGITSYILRGDDYTRPMSFFVLVSLAVGVLVSSILVSKLNGKRLYIVLCQIAAVGLLLEWTVTLMYPTIVGLDPWWHQWYTLKIIADGGIQTLQQLLPIFSIVVAGVMKATGLGYRLSTMVSVSLIQVVADAFLVYGLARLAFNRRIALLSSLLVAVSGWHVWFGYWTVPNTLGATLALAVAYFMARWHRNRHVWELAVMCLAFVVLLFTHPIATLWAVMGMALYFGGVVAYRIVCQRRLHMPIRLVVPLVVLLGIMGAWWGTDMGYFRTMSLFAHGKFAPSYTGYAYTPAPMPIVVNPPASVASSNPAPVVAPLYDESWEAGSYWETLSNSSGMFLFFALSILGCLCTAREWRRKPMGVYLVLFGFIVLCIGYFPMLFGMSVIEHRWWYFAQILMAMPLAMALVNLAGVGNNLERMILIPLAVAVLAFLSSMGLPANMDNYTFSKNQLVRYALTEPEVQALRDVMPCYNGKVALDSFYSMVAVHIMGYDIINYNVENLQSALLSGDFSAYNAVMIRDEIVNRSFAHGGGMIYRLNYDPRLVLEKQGFVKVYDNGSVSAFAKAP